MNSIYELNKYCAKHDKRINYNKQNIVNGFVGDTKEFMNGGL